jgi:hypothetical protein
MLIYLKGRPLLTFIRLIETEIFSLWGIPNIPFSKYVPLYVLAKHMHMSEDELEVLIWKRKTYYAIKLESGVFVYPTTYVRILKVHTRNMFKQYKKSLRLERVVDVLKTSSHTD